MSEENSQKIIVEKILFLEKQIENLKREIRKIWSNIAKLEEDIEDAFDNIVEIEDRLQWTKKVE